MKILCLSTIVLASLGGCADMSGLGGTKHFACKAPAGVHCESLSATYHNSMANNLPAQRGRTAPSSKDAVDAGSFTSAHPTVSPAAVGLAPAGFRVPAREMRIWIKAWQDEDQDLVDQSYVYVMVDKGQWRVAHVQQRERDAFARLTPPPSVPAQESSPTIQSGQSQPAAPAPLAPDEGPVEPTGK